MANHKKPTSEELEAQQKAALEANPEPEPSKPEPSEPAPEPEPSEPAPSEPSPESVPEPEPEPEPQAEPSEEEKERLKKKLSASAREIQKIYAKNRVINKALTETDDIPDPTEEELTAEFPDWDMMSDTEKIFAKETVISRNWRKVISNAKEQATKIEKWNESVDTFVDDPKTLIDNPELEGKTNEFREFALQEASNNVPFNLLVSAFLHEHSKNKPANKGRMFEKGSGGPNEKPQPKKGTITLEEARKLRETDYNKYKEYLIAGKIESDL